VHIVYMGDKPRGDFSAASAHHSMLENVLGSTSSAKESLVYSYGRSFNGFAARLSEVEVHKISKMDGVVSVMPNHLLKLHTTRSWDFMGFSQGKLGAPLEGNVVVGLLDTGIWPESESFNDEVLLLPNGKANAQVPISPATSREVEGASSFGLAKGVARGGVPNARIAMYKVCWSLGCFSADILAAFDDAIADGVDIISVSLGSVFPLQYMEDPIAIGSYHAMRHGIVTSCSAANSGPYPYSVANYAPWIMTVAASTIDRKFISQAVLGNGLIIPGLSVNSFDLNGTTYPLIWGGDAANYSAGANPEIASVCFPGAMNTYKVAKRIVFCEARRFVSAAILMADGAGVIMADSSFSDVAFGYPLPATVISVEDGKKILDYIRSTENPIATIIVSETWKDAMAPTVVSFSSRGPNPITPDILKPDITAPGVDILAAWSPVSPPSGSELDTRRTKFNIISGTSMSCPHASGAAAYVKAAHPNWSAAAIKSALMTTATIMDPRKHPDLEFGYGAGHINPAKAIDPGLVYDATEQDYINFLCKQGYNTTTLRLITGTNSSFCSSTKLGRAWDLNYPTFSVAVEDGQLIDAVFTRTVTNVGSPNSTYTLSMHLPYSVTVSVQPSTLKFSYFGEKKTFEVKVYGPKIWQQPIMSGAITWSDGKHVVRSPLVVYNILPGEAYGAYSMEQGKSKFQVPSMYLKNGILDRN
ncbi:hypothetical protein Tsubulata_001995, partial [Turnera subulata]